MKKIFAILLLTAFALVLLAPAFAETSDSAVIRIDLTQIIVSVIGLIFSFLVTWLMKSVVPSIKEWIETRTTESQRNMMNTLIRQLVHAAEQTMSSGSGKEKLKYVCDQLEDRGYSVDFDIIEATVKEMNDAALNEVIGIEAVTSETKSE